MAKKEKKDVEIEAKGEVSGLEEIQALTQSIVELLGAFGVSNSFAESFTGALEGVVSAASSTAAIEAYKKQIEGLNKALKTLHELGKSFTTQDLALFVNGMSTSANKGKLEEAQKLAYDFKTDSRVFGNTPQKKSGYTKKYNNQTKELFEDVKNNFSSRTVEDLTEYLEDAVGDLNKTINKEAPVIRGVAEIEKDVEKLMLHGDEVLRENLDEKVRAKVSERLKAFYTSLLGLFEKGNTRGLDKNTQALWHYLKNDEETPEAFGKLQDYINEYQVSLVGDLLKQRAGKGSDVSHVIPVGVMQALSFAGSGGTGEGSIANSNAGAFDFLKNSDSIFNSKKLNDQEKLDASLKLLEDFQKKFRFSENNKVIEAEKIDVPQKQEEAAKATEELAKKEEKLAEQTEKLTEATSNFITQMNQQDVNRNALSSTGIEESSLNELSKEPIVIEADKVEMNSPELQKMTKAELKDSILKTRTSTFENAESFKTLTGLSMMIPNDNGLSSMNKDQLIQEAESWVSISNKVSDTLANAKQEFVAKVYEINHDIVEKMDLISKAGFKPETVEQKMTLTNANASTEDLFKFREEIMRQAAVTNEQFSKLFDKIEKAEQKIEEKAEAKEASKPSEVKVESKTETETAQSLSNATFNVEVGHFNIKALSEAIQSGQDSDKPLVVDLAASAQKVTRGHDMYTAGSGGAVTVTDEGSLILGDKDDIMAWVKEPRNVVQFLDFIIGHNNTLGLLKNIDTLDHTLLATLQQNGLSRREAYEVIVKVDDQAKGRTDFYRDEDKKDFFYWYNKTNNGQLQGSRAYVDSQIDDDKKVERWEQTEIELKRRNDKAAGIGTQFEVDKLIADLKTSKWLDQSQINDLLKLLDGNLANYKIVKDQFSTLEKSAKDSSKMEKTYSEYRQLATQNGYPIVPQSTINTFVEMNRLLNDIKERIAADKVSGKSEKAKNDMASLKTRIRDNEWLDAGQKTSLLKLGRNDGSNLDTLKTKFEELVKSIKDSVSFEQKESIYRRREQTAGVSPKVINNNVDLARSITELNKFLTKQDAVKKQESEALKAERLERDKAIWGVRNADLMANGVQGVTGSDIALMTPQQFEEFKTAVLKAELEQKEEIAKFKFDDKVEQAYEKAQRLGISDELGYQKDEIDTEKKLLEVLKKIHDVERKKKNDKADAKTLKGAIQKGIGHFNSGYKSRRGIFGFLTNAFDNKMSDTWLGHLGGKKVTGKDGKEYWEGGVSGSAASLGLAIDGIKKLTGVIWDLGKGALNAFGEIQSIKVNLGVVYGNQGEADSMFNEIKNYAIKSPFGVQQVSEFAVLLKQSGVYASDLMDTLSMIGDVAGGNQEKFQRIANNYAQIIAANKATSLDLRQFANAGLPIYKEIRKELELSQKEVRKMTQEGKIGADIIEKVFKNMTSEGGIFYGAVNKGAQTYKARIQNLSDQKQMAQANAGEWIYSWAPTQALLDATEKILNNVEDWFGEWNDANKIEKQNKHKEAVELIQQKIAEATTPAEKRRLSLLLKKTEDKSPLSNDQYESLLASRYSKAFNKFNELNEEREGFEEAWNNYEEARKRNDKDSQERWETIFREQYGLDANAAWKTRALGVSLDAAGATMITAGGLVNGASAAAAGGTGGFSLLGTIPGVALELLGLATSAVGEYVRNAGDKKAKANIASDEEIETAKNLYESMRYKDEHLAYNSLQARLAVDTSTSEILKNSNLQDSVASLNDGLNELYKSTIAYSDEQWKQKQDLIENARQKVTLYDKYGLDENNIHWLMGLGSSEELKSKGGLKERMKEINSFLTTSQEDKLDVKTPEGKNRVKENAGDVKLLLDTFTEEEIAGLSDADKNLNTSIRNLFKILYEDFDYEVRKRIANQTGTKQSFDFKYRNDHRGAEFDFDVNEHMRLFPEEAEKIKQTVWDEAVKELADAAEKSKNDKDSILSNLAFAITSNSGANEIEKKKLEAILDDARNKSLPFWKRMFSNVLSVPEEAYVKGAIQTEEDSINYVRSASARTENEGIVKALLSDGKSLEELYSVRFNPLSADLEEVRKKKLALSEEFSQKREEYFQKLDEDYKENLSNIDEEYQDSLSNIDKEYKDKFYSYISEGNDYAQDIISRSNNNPLDIDKDGFTRIFKPLEFMKNQIQEGFISSIEEMLKDDLIIIDDNMNKTVNNGYYDKFSTTNEKIEAYVRNQERLIADSYREREEWLRRASEGMVPSDVTRVLIHPDYNVFIDQYEKTVKEIEESSEKENERLNKNIADIMSIKDKLDALGNDVAYEKSVTHYRHDRRGIIRSKKNNYLSSIEDMLKDDKLIIDPEEGELLNNGYYDNFSTIEEKIEAYIKNQERLIISNNLDRNIKLREAEDNKKSIIKGLISNNPEYDKFIDQYNDMAKSVENGIDIANKNLDKIKYISSKMNEFYSFELQNDADRNDKISELNNDNKNKISELNNAIQRDKEAFEEMYNGRIDLLENSIKDYESNLKSLSELDGQVDKNKWLRSYALSLNTSSSVTSSAMSLASSSLEALQTMAAAADTRMEDPSKFFDKEYAKQLGYNEKNWNEIVDVLTAFKVDYNKDTGKFNNFTMSKLNEILKEETKFVSTANAVLGFKQLTEETKDSVRNDEVLMAIKASTQYGIGFSDTSLQNIQKDIGFMAELIAAANGITGTEEKKEAVQNYITMYINDPKEIEKIIGELPSEIEDASGNIVANDTKNAARDAYNSISKLTGLLEKSQNLAGIVAFLDMSRDAKSKYGPKTGIDFWRNTEQQREIMQFFSKGADPNRDFSSWSWDNSKQAYLNNFQYVPGIKNKTKSILGTGEYIDKSGSRFTMDKVETREEVLLDLMNALKALDEKNNDDIFLPFWQRLSSSIMGVPEEAFKTGAIRNGTQSMEYVQASQRRSENEAVLKAMFADGLSMQDVYNKKYNPYQTQLDSYTAQLEKAEQERADLEEAKNKELLDIETQFNNRRETLLEQARDSNLFGSEADIENYRAANEELSTIDAAEEEARQKVIDSYEDERQALDDNIKELKEHKDAYESFDRQLLAYTGPNPRDRREKVDQAETNRRLRAWAMSNQSSAATTQALADQMSSNLEILQTMASAAATRMEDGSTYFDEEYAKNLGYNMKDLNEVKNLLNAFSIQWDEKTGQFSELTMQKLDELIRTEASAARFTQSLASLKQTNEEIVGRTKSNNQLADLRNSEAFGIGYSDESLQTVQSVTNDAAKSLVYALYKNVTDKQMLEQYEDSFRRQLLTSPESLRSQVEAMDDKIIVTKGEKEETGKYVSSDVKKYQGAMEWLNAMITSYNAENNLTPTSEGYKKSFYTDKVYDIKRGTFGESLDYIESKFNENPAELIKKLGLEGSNIDSFDKLLEALNSREKEVVIRDKSGRSVNLDRENALNALNKYDETIRNVSGEQYSAANAGMAAVVQDVRSKFNATTPESASSWLQYMFGAVDTPYINGLGNTPSQQKLMSSMGVDPSLMGYDAWISSLTPDKTAALANIPGLSEKTQEILRTGSYVDNEGNLWNTDDPQTMKDVMDEVAAQQEWLEAKGQAAQQTLATLSGSVAQGLTTTFERLGESMAGLADDSKSMADAWKEIGKNMLSTIGANLTNTGLQIAGKAASEGKWAMAGKGLMLAAAGGIASITAGMIDTGDNNNKDNGEKERIQNLKDALADLIDQAKTDAEYYDRNLLHRKALSENQEVSGRSIRVNDAIIAPNGNVISTAPDDYLIATKTPESLLGNAKEGATGIPEIVVKPMIINNSSAAVKGKTTATLDANGNLELITTIVDLAVEKVEGKIANGEMEDVFAARDYRNNGHSVTS